MRESERIGNENERRDAEIDRKRQNDERQKAHCYERTAGALRRQAFLRRSPEWTITGASASETLLLVHVRQPFRRGNGGDFDRAAMGTRSRVGHALNRDRTIVSE